MYIYIYICQVRRNWVGLGGSSPPPDFCKLVFFMNWKKSLKVKNSTKLKTSWNSAKVFDISIITFDLDTRDSILSVINCERFSHFLQFIHYNTKEDTIHAIFVETHKTNVL